MQRLSAWACRISLLLLPLSLLTAQPSTPQGRLRELQRAIEELRAQLQQTQTRAQALQQQLAQQQRYTQLLERSIALLEQELHRTDDSIGRLRREIEALLGVRAELSLQQQRLLRQLYRVHRTATAPGQLERLRVYTRTLFRELGRRDALLSAQQDTLQRLLERLQELQQQRQQWLERRREQYAERQRSIQQQQQLLAQLQRQQRQLEQKLQQRRAEARALERMVSRLARLETPPRRVPEQASLVPVPLGSGQPRFAPPVPIGRLLRGYGRQRNPETGIEWDNPGIDIAVERGTPVRAIAPGVVKTLTWLPTYQYVLILEHAGGFRSVYANLERVNVVLGSSVTAGQILGSSGQTPEGEGIHFQLWQNRQRLDPLKWIR